MKNWWNILTIDQRIALAFFSTLSIAGLVVTLLAPIESQNYFALATATFVFLLFERVSRFYFEKKVMDGFQELARGQADLKNIGGISSGIDWFKRNNRGLKLVRNTVFTRSDRDSFTLTYGDLEEAVKASLRDGCEWRDLYSSSESDVVSAFHARLDANEKTNYTASELRDDIPLLQVMLLTYKEPRKVAVLFGWSHRGGKEIESQVFLSQDLQTFLFFDNYFDALAARAQKTIVPPINPSPTKPDRSKRWLSLRQS